MSTFWTGIIVPGKAKDEKRGYKYARIKTDLSIQILEGQLRPHDRIPSLNEIALKYKVSKITARRVLNDLVKEGLVYANRGRGSFVADSGTHRNSRLPQNSSNNLGVVFEHASGSFMGDIITGIDEEAFHQKAQIALCISNNSYQREAEILQRLVQQGITRILLFMALSSDATAVNPNIPLYLRLQEQGVRTLLLACRIPGFPIPAITYDDYGAFLKLVGFLKERRVRRLAYVMRMDNASTSLDRLRGFKDGHLEHNLPYDEKRIVRVTMQGYETLVSDASAAFGKFLKEGGTADAVLCSDEMVAAGVFDALERAGVAASARPVVGGMGSAKNLHVLKGNPYLLLEADTYRLGREAAAALLSDEVPMSAASVHPYHRVIPVPMRVPKSLKL